MSYGRQPMDQRIAIYADAGTGDFSVFCAQDYFRPSRLCDAASVISGDIFNQCDIFVMPGGADRPYAKALNGPGNRNIRTFVEGGGTYLGICAGAYYGCRDIAYHMGRSDEICGSRELAFIDALAYGSLPKLAGYYDETLATAGWAGLITENGPYQAFYHGGCAFEMNDSAARVLAHYAGLPGQPPAIIEKQIGRGRAILSGVHFEVMPGHLAQWTWQTDVDRNAAQILTSFTLTRSAGDLIGQMV